MSADSNYTIGKLKIGGTYFCDTLEDKDRGLTSKMTLDEVKEIKVPGQTAIPTGEYVLDMNTVSPRFGKLNQYKFCDGKLPRLIGVPGYEGVLIHIGNYHTDTDGCILVGENKAKGAVLNSTNTFVKLYKILKDARDNKENITITIK